MHRPGILCPCSCNCRTTLDSFNLNLYLYLVKIQTRSIGWRIWVHQPYKIHQTLCLCSKIISKAENIALCSDCIKVIEILIFRMVQTAKSSGYKYERKKCTTIHLRRMPVMFSYTTVHCVQFG